MATTKLANLINPQVMGDKVSGDLTKSLKMKQFYEIDTTLKGRAGNTITIPQYAYIGEAKELAEGVAGEVTQMTATDKEYTVKKAVKNVELTDEAILGGYGDPVGEATRQLKLAIEDKIDSDGVAQLTALTSSTEGVQYVDDSTTEKIGYNAVIDGLDGYADIEQGAQVFMMVTKAQLKALRKDPKFLDNTTVGAELLKSGVLGSIGGAYVVRNTKLTDENHFYLLRPKSLTAFIKRDVTIETERKMLEKATVIGADEHYTVAIKDLSKIVKVKVKTGA